MEPTLSEENATRLINLHAVEYQTLTTRCTYWIALHVALISLIPVYLTAVMFLWTSSPIDRRLLFWASVIILETVGLIYLHIQGEQYVVVLYIEKILRPAVTKIITQYPIWGYEPFLVQLRSSATNPQFIPALWEFPIAVVATLFVPTILLHSYIQKGSVILSGSIGWGGFILYIFFVVFIWWKSITVRHIRLEFSEEVRRSIGR